MGIQSLRYFWKATYKDGSSICQFEEGKERLFSEIDQSRLESFAWVPFNSSDPVIIIKLEPWQRLIAVRRNFITTGPEGESRKTIYLLGWQSTINGRNYKSICYIDPSEGTITMEGK